MPAIADENRRILVVDDTEGIHADFRKILSSSGATGLDALESDLFGDQRPAPSSRGFEVTSAMQGQEGFERVREAAARDLPYALAFVDMRMPPGWDGLETIERCFEIDPHLQVVICTAYSDYPWEEIQKRVGQTDRILVLKKPFDNVEVSQLASALARKWNLARDLRRRIEDLEAAVETRTRDLDRARTDLERIVLAVPSFLIGIDAAGRVVSWNPAAEAILGIAGAAATGRELVALPIPWDAETVRRGLDAARAGEGDAVLDRIRFRRPMGGGDGMLSAKAIPSGPGAEQDMLLVGEDVTDRPMLEPELAPAGKPWGRPVGPGRGEA